MEIWENNIISIYLILNFIMNSLFSQSLFYEYKESWDLLKYKICYEFSYLDLYIKMFPYN